MIQNNIINKCFPKKLYNCITFSVHERYQTGLADTNTNFYMLNFENMGFKPWDTRFAPIPDNHMFLTKDDVFAQIPQDITFDFILSQNKFGNYQIAKSIQKYLHIPIIQLEHTLPPRGISTWPQERIDACKAMLGEINVFISDYSKGQWEASEDAETVHHCVDGEVFVDMGLDREDKVLSIVNDFIGRDFFCGYHLWKNTVENLPYEVWGNTPGLSEPTKSVEHLVEIYNKSKIFLNTSLVSPIPTVLLEAMSCGCAPVSTSNCMIPEIITHGENGLLANSSEELAAHCNLLLEDDELRIKLAENAKKTAKEMFSKQRFVSDWNNIFDRAARMPYLGDR